MKYLPTKKYLLIFTAMFPLLSGFASFENHGMPLNYLLLPLVLLAGIYLGELILNKKKALSILNNINNDYYYFLLIIFISFIFILFRWANISINNLAFFKDTQVCPQSRLSFAIIFPLLYITLFYISYIFKLYIFDEKKDILLIYFLIGFSINTIFSFLQTFVGVKLFLSHKVGNGLSSDASAFGFLSVIAFLGAFLLFYKYKYKKLGSVFMLIAFISILYSQTRIGIIAMIFIILFVFFRLNFKKQILLFLIIILLLVNFIYYFNASEFENKLTFVNELENTFWSSLQYIKKGQTEENVRVITSKRNLLWGYSLDIAKRFPVSGVGVGNFVFFVMYEKFGLEFHHDLPSNQYLHVLSSLGFIGLLIFLIFIFNQVKKNRGIYLYVIFCVLVIMIFGNYLWIPECFLAFWLIVSLGEFKEKSKQGSKLNKYFYVSLLMLFILGNMISFSSLLPRNFAKKTNTMYDYGFWYEEKNESGEIYKWTKVKSGVYIYLKNGVSKTYKIICGAPLEHLPDKKQIVEIYWRGKLYKQIVFFNNNREFSFRIKDRTYQDGFLEMRVFSVFNLKKMNLSPETRNLGVQFFY